MLKQIAILAAALCVCVGARAEKIECPEPLASEVSGNVQTKLAALGKLGAVELKSKTPGIVKPLLEKVPNADRADLADTLLNVFCQIVSDQKIDVREQLDRFQVFGTQVMTLVNSTAAQQPKTPSPAPPK